MEISHIEQTVKKIHLSNETVNEITLKRLYQLVSPGEYLRDKKGVMWLTQDDPHWRHGSISEETVRKATDLDIAVFAVIKALREVKS